MKSPVFSPCSTPSRRSGGEAAPACGAVKDWKVRRPLCALVIVCFAFGSSWIIKALDREKEKDHDGKE